MSVDVEHPTWLDLEAPIGNLSLMAGILADMLEHNLRDVRTICGRERPKGDDWQISLTDEQVSQLVFAVGDVESRAFDLRETFYAIHKAKGGKT